MKITYFGQNGFMFEIGDYTIITDPFITPNPLAKDKVKLEDLKADYILLTHAHGDHVADVEALAKQTGATIVCNAEMADYYSNKDFTVHPMNHGGSWMFDFGKVKYVNAIHSSTFPDGTPGGNPGGFVITAEDKTVYMAGDTALTMDMKLIPLTQKVDLAILPIGDNYTMGVDDAVIASDFVACDKVLGCHYNTFGYIEIDTEAAQEKFKNKNKELILLDVAEHITL